MDDKTPKLERWIIRGSGGLIKNEQQARYALIAVVVLACFIAFWISSTTTKTQGLTNEQIQQIIKSQQNAYTPK